MSNTYFKLKSHKKDEYNGLIHEVSSAVSLTAFVAGKDNPNSIQMTIAMKESKTGSNDQYSTSWISLNEEQQNQLIAGILERRGLSIGFDDEGNIFWSHKNRERISATGDEQSSICPYTEDNDIV